MTGNLGRNQDKVLQRTLWGEKTTTTIMSGVGLEGLPTRNPKLKYTHTVTHEATTLKDPGQPPPAPVPQKLDFGSITKKLCAYSCRALVYQDVKMNYMWPSIPKHVLLVIWVKPGFKRVSKGFQTPKTEFPNCFPTVWNSLKPGF